MNISRIYAIVLRNLMTFRTNYDRLFDAFFWPTIDMLLWGLTSAYFIKLAPDFAKIIIVVISGLTFWLIVHRSQYETSVSLLEDIWSKNLINIFVSPLTVMEWIVSVTIIGFIKSMMSFVLAGILALVLYKVGIFMYGFYILPFLFLLLMTSWWTAYLIIGCILWFGTRVQTFAWTLVFIIAPFSGIYYPLSSLHPWVQEVSKFIPTSYVFEGIREVINTGHVSPDKIIVSFILNLLYLILSLIFLRWTYKKLLNRGLLKII